MLNIALMLAQSTMSVENLVTPIGFVGALMFIVKWFMKAVDDRNEVIRNMADKSNGVSERSIVAMEGMTRAVDSIVDRQRGVEYALRTSPCGAGFDQKMKSMGLEPRLPETKHVQKDVV